MNIKQKQFQYLKICYVLKNKLKTEHKHLKKYIKKIQNIYLKEDKKKKVK